MKAHSARSIHVHCCMIWWLWCFKHSMLSYHCNWPHSQWLNQSAHTSWWKKVLRVFFDIPNDNRNEFGKSNNKFWLSPFYSKLKFRLFSYFRIDPTIKLIRLCLFLFFIFFHSRIVTLIGIVHRTCFECIETGFSLDSLFRMTLLSHWFVLFFIQQQQIMM